MTSDTSSSVWTQKKKGRRRQEGRKRRRIELTWPPDLIEELRKRTDNISSFTERIIRAVLFQEPVELVAIIPKTSGPGGIRTLDRPVMSRLAKIKTFRKLS